MTAEISDFAAALHACTPATRTAMATLGIRSLNELFVCATTKNQSGLSCIQFFMHLLKETVEGVTRCAVCVADVYLIAGVVVRSIFPGMPVVVVWAEGETTQSYACTAHPSALGWTVRSEAFVSDDVVLFDPWLDEWYVPVRQQ